jgi:hypothetical protein
MAASEVNESIPVKLNNAWLKDSDSYKQDTSVLISDTGQCAFYDIQLNIDKFGIRML